MPGPAVAGLLWATLLSPQGPHPLCPATLLCPAQRLPAVDACDSDIQLRCPPDGPPPVGGADPVWRLGRVTDCLWQEVSLDRAALAAQAQASGAADPSVGAGASTEGSTGAAGGAGAEPQQRRRRLAQGGGVGDDDGDAAWPAAAGGGAEAEAEAGQVQVEARAEPELGAACRAFLDVALPADAFEEFQGRCAAAALESQPTRAALQRVCFLQCVCAVALGLPAAAVAAAAPASPAPLPPPACAAA